MLAPKHLLGLRELLALGFSFGLSPSVLFC
jgi:hypothetical protein